MVRPVAREERREPVYYFHDPNPEGVLAAYLMEFFAELAAERARRPVTETEEPRNET